MANHVYRIRNDNIQITSFEEGKEHTKAPQTSPWFVVELV